MKIKNITKLFFLTFVLLSITSSVLAQQNLKINKRSFYVGEQGFKEAWKAIKQGNAEFIKGKVFYRFALEHYLKAYDYNANNPELTYKIGACYLYSKNKLKSIEYLEKAYEIDQYISFDIDYLLGRAYHLNTEFDKAIEKYEVFKENIPPKEFEKYKPLAERRIQECINGKEIVKEPLRLYVDNMGEAINTEYPDYVPLTPTKDSIMYFTSRRAYFESAPRNNFDNRFYEDIYFSTKDSIQETWTEPLLIGKPITTDKYNDATIGLSPDGKTLYLYRCRKKDHGDIFYSNWDEEKLKWSKPKKVKGDINLKKTHESSATITADGTTMYFVSNRNTNKYPGFGEHDIYIATKDLKGKWSSPFNMGADINTPYDELTVFVSPDGMKLYFASNGHKTMGGYDIFVSELDSAGDWSTPKNIGYPINSPDDEIAYIFGEENHYYASIRPDGYGDFDIYQITFMGEEKPSYQNYAVHDSLIIYPAHPGISIDCKEQITGTILQGKITNIRNSSQPVAATINIIDKVSNEVLSSANSNPENGKYVMELPGGANYSISIKAKDYMFYSDTITVIKTADYQVIRRDFLVVPLEIGEKVVLKNVFFDSGKTTLKTESYPELNILIQFMRDNPTVILEVSGHTDNVGSKSFNTRLSRDRAKSVVSYLVEFGNVNPARLVAVGYAFSQPVESNDTEEGRAKNRRVEAKIIAK